VFRRLGHWSGEDIAALTLLPWTSVAANPQVPRGFWEQDIGQLLEARNPVITGYHLQMYQKPCK